MVYALNIRLNAYNGNYARCLLSPTGSDSFDLIFMLKLGYACEHEEYQPQQLLEYAVEAEKAGFDSVWTSDHFHPWAHKNAAGGMAWVWMASAAERTNHIEFGTAVTCPILRYNPAIVAQAFATMRAMYPGRIFIGVGTGEALNEMPVGCQWPSFRERAERLEEAVKVMKLLWSKDFVNFKGKFYRLRKANLYTRPATPPPIYIAAAGPTVAEMAGRIGDGFLTVGSKQYRDVLLPAVERGARSVGRDPNEIVKAIEIHVSYDQDYEKALAKARFWAGGALPSKWYNFEIYDPRELDEHGLIVGDKQIAQGRCIGTKPEDHIKYLENYVKMGFQHIYVQSSSPDEIQTLRMYAKEVLPYIRTTYGKGGK